MLIYVSIVFKHHFRHIYLTNRWDSESFLNDFLHIDQNWPTSKPNTHQLCRDSGSSLEHLTGMVLLARCSLFPPFLLSLLLSLPPISLSLFLSLTHPWNPSCLPPVSVKSWYMLVFTGRPIIVCLCVRVARKTLLMSSSFLNSACSSYLDGLWNGKQVVKQLLFCEMLLLEFAQ